MSCAIEEDNEELLQETDDDSLSEAEDQCCPVDKPQDRTTLSPITFFPHTKLEFFVTLICLVLSSLVLLIVLPLYINTINAQGNVFSLIIFNVPLSTTVLVVMLIILKFLQGKFDNSYGLRALPAEFSKMIQISSIYVLCGYFYFYSSDRNRVLCHLQDPFKGIVLVFALLDYFFFCRNLMGLHRIFSTTAVIVGLFIAVDYGLCDEFVCRGYDRRTIPDDAGPWSWKIHSIWTGLYILGLNLFAAFLTLLDRLLSPEAETSSATLMSTSLLSTISRTVTPSSSQVPPPPHREGSKRNSALHFAVWIHIFALGLILATFWVDFIPGIGKGVTVSESFNYTLEGVKCHFTRSSHDCVDVFWYMIIFQVAYVTFTVSSVKFLMLSQSAVFTVATMCFALPLVGIWWTLFYANPSGHLVWAPKVRGESICSIIGLPVVGIGLALLCKAHFIDNRKYVTVRTAASRHQVA